MSVINRFCVCFNSRTGSVFTGFYSLITSAIFIGVILMRFLGFELIQQSQKHAVILTSTLVVFSMLIIASFVLVIAVYKDEKNYLYPWLICASLAMVVGTCMLLWNVITELKQRGILDIWEILILVYHSINVVMTSYCMACVHSQLRALADGKGTASYHRRQEHHRDTRTMRASFANDITALGDFDLFSPIPPAYMNKPPPYSTIDYHGAFYRQPLRDTCTLGKNNSHNINVNQCGINSRNDPREPIPRRDVIEALSMHVPFGVPPPDYAVIAPPNGNIDMFQRT